MELDLPPVQQDRSLADLAVAIQRAAEAALSEPSSSQAAAAVAVLHDAHAAIGCFLSLYDGPASAPSCEDQPMADGCEEEMGEQMVGGVEEGLRECALQGRKRRKRSVPPSWPLGRRSSGVSVAPEAAPPALDVVGQRRAAMDLLLQFHA